MSVSSVSSVSSSSVLQQLEALYQKMESKLATSTTSTSGTASTTPTDTDSVSGIGKLLSNLQDLATSDPAKFKQETADIAKALNHSRGQHHRRRIVVPEGLVQPVPASFGHGRRIGPRAQTPRSPQRRVQRHQFERLRCREPVQQHELVFDAEHGFNVGEQLPVQQPADAVEQPLWKH